jgi:hypothetical protein
MFRFQEVLGNYQVAIPLVASPVMLSSIELFRHIVYKQKQHVLLKVTNDLTRLHGVTSQKTVIFALTTTGASDLFHPKAAPQPPHICHPISRLEQNPH